jgi:hypothetical protein
MSVPTSISQLSTTPALNSPAGTEQVGNNLSLYLNAHAAFIAQIANGSGLNTTGNLNMNSFQINNLAPGVLPTDAANMSQLNASLPIGAIVMYGGSVANIASVWGPKWALCNGFNGTPDLLNRFVIAAGDAYAPGAYGGQTSYTLSTANMPVHNHAVYDAGHTHGVLDGGHTHVIDDHGHAHPIPAGGIGQAGTDNGGGGLISPTNGYGTWSGAMNGTSIAGTGVSVVPAVSSVSIYAASTGITVENAGSGAAITIIPPFYALCYLMKIA